MSDSSLIDAAVSATVLGDGALMTLAPDGVFFDAAAQGAERFVLISLVESLDEGVFGGRAIESAVYLIKYVEKSLSGLNAKAAAARIDAIFEDQPLNLSIGSPAGVPGYTWMATYREERVRYTEVDEVDASIRWQHRGGRYRIEMSVTA